MDILWTSEYEKECSTKGLMIMYHLIVYANKDDYYYNKTQGLFVKYRKFI